MDEEEEARLSARDHYAIARLLNNESGETGDLELDPTISDTILDEDLFTFDDSLELDPATRSQTLRQIGRPRVLPLQSRCAAVATIQSCSTAGPSQLNATTVMDEDLLNRTDHHPIQPDEENLPHPAGQSSKKLRMLPIKEHLQTAGFHSLSMDTFSPLPSPMSVASPSDVAADTESVPDEDQFCAEYFSNYHSDEDSTFLDDFGAAMDLNQMSPPSSDEEEAQSLRNDSVPDPPVYKGAPITVRESLTAILSFVQSEHISGAGVGRLLSLINLHLLQPNNFMKTNAQLFKKLGVDDPVAIHYFCSICYKSRKGPTDLCDSCADTSKHVQYFITFPLESQLKKMFERPDFVEDIKYRQTRSKKNNENIEDICDGEVFKEAEKSFVENCLHVSLMWNTDGMQVFTSNTFSLWPFYLVITDLSPKKRFLSENLLIGGVWGSVVKPHPNVFLLPIYKELKALEKGVDVKSNGNSIKVIVKVVCGTCDSPAKACFLNMKSHSGFYSCPVCTIRGQKPSKDVPTVFPYEENVRLRNLDDYQRHVKWAVDHKVILYKTPRNEEKWCGIKGPTILSSIEPNIFDSTATDSMHCVDLGVTRQMLHLWFDKDNKDQNFSIFKKLNEVNKRMRDLTPPHYLQRTPQTIDKLIHWKATELRSFLVNLSLIVLENILMPAYYAHLALFVKGVSLLNTSSVSEEDLVLASLFLNQFVSQFQDLYGIENMSFNLHMCTHLERIVRKLGPLWSIGCYKLEDINGRLGNFIHGTCHVGLQIYSNLSIVTKLPLMVQNLREGAAKNYCNSLLKKRYRLKISEKIGTGLYCVGPLRCVNSAYIITVLQTVVAKECNVQVYSRLLKDSMLYVSSSYSRGKKISSYVKYSKDGIVMYGNVDCFACISCMCSISCNCTREHVAIIKPKAVNVLEIQGIEVSHLFRHYCTDVCKDLTSFDVIRVSDLQTVLFKINGSNEIFLCEPLNDFEKD